MRRSLFFLNECRPEYELVLTPPPTGNLRFYTVLHFLILITIISSKPFIVAQPPLIIEKLLVFILELIPYDAA